MREKIVILIHQLSSAIYVSIVKYVHTVTYVYKSKDNISLLLINKILVHVITYYTILNPFVMTGKFEQWWSTIPSTKINKMNNRLSPQIIEHKKTTTYMYDVGNPWPGLGHAQKGGGVKPVNKNPTLSLLIIGSPMQRQCK
jgi:hypothetical protein